jgi:general L-amino acid transport system permease protein
MDVDFPVPVACHILDHELVQPAHCANGAVSMSDIAYVAADAKPALPPPPGTSGWVGWLRQNLFSSPLNIVLTGLGAYLLYVIVPPAVRFLITDAVFVGADRQACLPSASNPTIGACWAYVWDFLGFFTYGFYPRDMVWRVNIAFVLFAVGLAWVLWLEAPRRGLGAIYFFVIFPIIAFFLIYGAPWLGLPIVTTEKWGGIMVSLIIAFAGIVASLPLGTVLALGRRSKLPVIRLLCVITIELVRGVPLITVLFMAKVMLPLMLPASVNVNLLVSAIIATAVFTGAYMAETIRGGLQSLPKGQYEGASALGLNYWKAHSLIILPQVYKISIPNIVNSYVAMFKDTTLVFIIGLFDFLKAIETSFANPIWATSVRSTTAYAFAGLFYFVCCYGMSRYAKFVEKRLAAAEKR